MSIMIRNRSQYEEALQEIARLREAGYRAENHPRLAALEAAVAKYTAREGEPDRSKGRPEQS